ncbi:helix-turn-helix transcriptional regulator [Nocardia sp. NPDC059180]|uniref:helix-turn-helix transcriptional regulator n=1 Tax=Nocardia sp. NPDC059180 TaxID=3346761 RepID=UPI0036815FA1
MVEIVDVRALRRARRRELGSFLRSRRARIAPADVGLTCGPRRRTPGLRREEVAELSGIGVTWYTWLEQGREINVSVQVLDAVARTLAFDEAEKAHLYRLANVPTVPSARGDTRLPEALSVILDQLDPLPAALLNARFDVLAHNNSYRVVCPGLVSGDRNVLRHVLFSPECCTTYRPDRTDLRRMVAFLRGEHAENLGDPSWHDFVTELRTTSGLFAELWDDNDIAVPVGLTKVIRHPAVGELETTMTVMAPVAAPRAWMQVFTPADEAVWARLRSLLEMSESQRRRAWRNHCERHYALAAG